MKVDDFDRQLERWSRRPGRLSPDQAAEAVCRRLEPRRSGKGRWAWAAVLVAGLGVAYLKSQPEVPSPLPQLVAADETEPGSVVVMELASGTQLYLQLPIESAKGVER